MWDQLKQRPHSDGSNCSHSIYDLWQCRGELKKKKSEEHKLHVAPSKLGICNIWSILFWWWLYSVPLDLSHKNPNQTCLIQKPTTKPWKESAEWSGGLQPQQDSLSLPIFSHFRMCICVDCILSGFSVSWGTMLLVGQGLHSYSLQSEGKI